MTFAVAFDVLFFNPALGIRSGVPPGQGAGRAMLMSARGGRGTPDRPCCRPVAGVFSGTGRA